MAVLEDPRLAPPPLSARSLSAFCTFITRELGIKMSPAKQPMLQSRLQRRLRELQLPSLDAYREHLFEAPGGADELVHFIDAVTTNKTDFFREPHHFNYLTEHALPALDPHAGKPGSPPWQFRLWCAGCSSGEEPYTIAMTLAEYGVQRAGFEFALLATDISTRVLAHAQRGIYDEERIIPVPAALRGSYLLRSKDRTRRQVRIVPELRGRISFQRLNFMHASYPVPEDLDVIFFRNVMIYFDKVTQEAVLNKLCRHLRPGGFLFVGHSESLGGLRVPVEPVSSAVYRRLA